MDKENARFKMIKRVEKKDDGRFIIYYDFENSDIEQTDSAGGKTTDDTKGSKD